MELLLPMMREKSYLALSSARRCGLSPGNSSAFLFAKAKSLVVSLDIHRQVPVSPARSSRENKYDVPQGPCQRESVPLPRNSWVRPRARRLFVTKMFPYI